MCFLILIACAPSPSRLTTSLQVTKLPPVWPQAHPITCNCGAYQAQAVLRANGEIVEIPKLYVSEWAREGCHTLPWDIPTILDRMGRLKTESYYEFSEARFVDIAKHALERRHPLIVLIQATKGHYGLHWISIWGYTAKQQDFLVYDSQYPTKVGGVGNARYSIPFLESRFPWWTTAAIEVED